MKTSKSILIVEDDVTVLGAIRRGLESSVRYDFEVKQAINPRDYISQELHKRRFDAGIIDLKLGGPLIELQGFRIILGALSEHPGSLAIVYSGQPSTKNIVRSMRLGAAEFISKAELAAHQLVSHVEDLFDGQQRSMDRHKALEELAKVQTVEWQRKYAGQHIVLVGDQIVASSPVRLEAMLNYDDLRTAHPEWPEEPDIIEVMEEKRP
jgi:DNA-binding NtrC family response regulator